MGWVAAAAAVVGSVVSSSSKRKAADRAAKGAREAGEISATAAREASLAEQAGIAAAASILAPNATSTAKLRAEAVRIATNFRKEGLTNANDIFQQGIADVQEQLGVSFDDIQQITDDILNGGATEAKQLAARSERAIEEGAEGATDALDRGFGAAAQEFSRAEGTAGEFNEQAVNRIESLFGRGRGDLQESTQKAIAGLREGIGRGREDVLAAEERGRAGLEPFREGGLAAQQEALARSGALGPEAQAAAFEQFQQAPDTQFKLDQARKLVESGGQGLGGERLRRLNELGLGIVSGDIQQQTENLIGLGGQGLSAATSQGQISAAMAPILAQLGISEGEGIAQLEQALGRDLSTLGAEEASQLATQLRTASQQITGIQTQGGVLEAERGLAEADVSTEKGAALAAIQEKLAPLLADINRQKAGLAGTLGVAEAGAQSDLALSGTERQAAFEEALQNAIAAGIVTSAELRAAGLDTRANILASERLGLGQAKARGLREAGGAIAQGEIGATNARVAEETARGKGLTDLLSTLGFAAGGGFSPAAAPTILARNNINLSGATQGLGSIFSGGNSTRVNSMGTGLTI